MIHGIFLIIRMFVIKFILIIKQIMVQMVDIYFTIFYFHHSPW